MRRKRRRLAVVAGLVLTLGLAGLAVVISDMGAQASVLSPGAHGWLAARHYLEKRGHRTSLLDVSMDETSSVHGVLVSVFPWQRAGGRKTIDGFKRHLANGGALLLGYSGLEPTQVERWIFERLGFNWLAPRGQPPIHPRRWREFAATEWDLTRDAAPVTEAGIVIRAPLYVPEASESARIWYRGEDDLPMIFEERRGHGRLVVLPAEALSNARLGNDGNADLLETLAVNLGSDWTFDEYHHGLTAQATPTRHVPRFAFDLILVHLALLYLMTAVALGRRLGPAWREPPVMAGSTIDFLVGVGWLHDRFRHYADAARLLLTRAEKLQPGLKIPGAWRERAERADRDELLRLSADVARIQRRKGT
jgi:hypothetical protein